LAPASRQAGCEGFRESMFIKVLRAKIHRATATEAEIDYVGSITIDSDLIEAVGMIPGEVVLVADLDNGTRHETYVVAGPAGSGRICVNGAAARLVHPLDKLIIMAHAYVSADEAGAVEPKILLVDDRNRPVRML
jgi:aspartate 1-decarboxylase